MTKTLACNAAASLTKTFYNVGTNSTKALEALQGMDNRSPAFDSGQQSKWSQ